MGFGLSIYQEAWQHFAQVNLNQLIAEWVPPVPFLWWLILLSGLVLFLILLFTAEFSNLILAFLPLLFGFLALKARRHLPFYFLVWFYLFFYLPNLKKILNSWLKNESFRNDLALLTIVFLLVFGFFRLSKTLATNLSWQNYCQNSRLSYPCGAIQFLRRQPPANIFNRYEWGGFLIWQLPEYKVFVDGRMPAWNHPSGRSPYTIYLETLQTQPGWQETLKEYKIDWILISPGTFMDLLLKPNPEKFDWQEVYRDKAAVIFKKFY
ncbi:hypothetical protein HZB97_00385 [Candidatus Gottesmanbacteria bacterium]|nr:hypothetical protein [Candidatus Gottesmanbacteria bacterium]